jgi:hypothetical protein
LDIVNHVSAHFVVSDVTSERGCDISSAADSRGARTFGAGSPLLVKDLLCRILDIILRRAWTLGRDTGRVGPASLHDQRKYLRRKRKMRQSREIGGRSSGACREVEFIGSCDPGELGRRFARELHEGRGREIG